MLTQSIYAAPLINYQYSYSPKSLYRVRAYCFIYWPVLLCRATGSMLKLINSVHSPVPPSLPQTGEHVNRNEAHETVTVHREPLRRAATTTAARDRPQANARKLQTGGYVGGEGSIEDITRTLFALNLRMKEFASQNC